MKQLFISALFLLGGLLNGNAQQPSLKFNKDGKFKIVQFTDVHYIYMRILNRPFRLKGSTKCWMQKNRTWFFSPAM